MVGLKVLLEGRTTACDNWISQTAFEDNACKEVNKARFFLSQSESSLPAAIAFLELQV